MMKKEQLIAYLMGVMAPLLGGSCGENKEGKNTAQQDLENLLQILERTPDSNRRMQMGAMCYSVGIPQEVEYVCPECHQRTQYGYPKYRNDMTEEEQKEEDMKFSCLRKLNDLMTYRREFAKLPPKAASYNISMELDESAFCNHCSQTHERAYFLIVKYPDGASHSTKLDGEHDLLMLEAFFEQRESWVSEAGGWEYLLKPEAPRIRELLGLPGKQTQQE